MTKWNSLNDHVEWLASMEAKAARIYRNLALSATDDEDLIVFARALWEEEEWHYRAIRSVERELINIVASRQHSNLIDNKVIKHIEKALSVLDDAVRSGELSTDELLEKILLLELSELNDVFISIVDLFAEYKVELQALRSHVRRHQHSIEAFARKRGIVRKEKTMGGANMDSNNNTILVVEDENTIRDVLVLALKRYGAVETAGNGLEALKMFKKKHYDLIYTDNDMPHMSGIDFYKALMNEDPYLHRRIVFFSGAIGEEEETFIRDQNISYLMKPASLNQIRQAAVDILERDPEK